MRNTLVQAALAASLLAGASVDHAATLSLSGWKFGSGNVMHTATPVYNG